MSRSAERQLRHSELLAPPTGSLLDDAAAIVPVQHDPDIPAQKGTWDLILAHCREVYQTDNGDGAADGNSALVEEVGKARNRLGFRRALVYEKCRSAENLGPGFEVVRRLRSEAP